jgi:LuxR family maltose regulon positive regulatory protein
MAQVEGQNLTSPLLAAKLFVPVVQQPGVARPHLLERLDQGLHQHHALFLLSAPAGYGKTALTAAWLAHLRVRCTPPPKIAWLSLDPADSDAERFFFGLLLALERVGLPSHGSLHALFQQTEPPTLEALGHAFLEDIVMTLTRVEAPLLLVLDDLHRLTSTELHATLQWVLDRLPPGCHLVILTREDPLLSLARWRVQKRVTEIRARDLRFSASEAAEFLNRIMALDLDEQLVAALAMRTEGWIAGLQLAALSLEHETDPAQFVATFAGDDRQVVDYLLDEVLTRQPSALRRFLLRTAILERMTGSLCDALLAPAVTRAAAEHTRHDPVSPDGQAVLAELERRNLFLVALDNRRQWYRYHHLFGDLLRAHLTMSVDQDEITELHLRAARWHAEQGYTAEAVNHALTAHADDLAAQFIEDALARPVTWSRGNMGQLRDWWQALPEYALRDRPLLWLRISRALYLSGQFDEATHLLDAAARTLCDQESRHPERESLLAQATVYRAAIWAMRGDAQRALDATLTALDDLPQAEILPRARAYDTLGLAFELLGDADKAVWFYVEAAVLAEEAGVLYLAVNARCEAAQVQILQGQLRQALASCRAAIALGERSDPDLPPLGLARAIIAEIQREQNQLELAQRGLEAAIACSRQVNIIDDLRHEYFYLARLCQAKGDVAAGLVALQEAELLLHAYKTPRLTQRLMAHRVRLWLAQGQLRAAQRWADEFEAPAGYLAEMEWLTVVRVRLAQGKAEWVRDEMMRLLPDAEAAGRLGTALEARMLLALAQAALGHDDAAELLADALVLAEPEGFVRLFLDEGSAMVALLHRIDPGHAGAAYSRHLLDLAEVSPARTRESLLQLSEGEGLIETLIETLSEREQEVLNLLAERLTNDEIAQRLVISLATVKSHTAHIYAKLDVGDRRAAVARARSIGLLPPS